MSEYHLDLWTWSNSVQMRTPTGSRWTANNYLTRCHRRLELVQTAVPVAIGVSWETRCRRENSSRQRAWALSDSRSSSRARKRKKCCYVQRNFGSICSSLFPSPTHFPHTTNIKPFGNKVWEVYFYKEVCSFVHWNSYIMLTMFSLIYVYVYV